MDVIIVWASSDALDLDVIMVWAWMLWSSDALDKGFGRRLEQHTNAVQKD